MLQIADEIESLISLKAGGKITEDDMETFTSSLEQKTSSSTGPFNALIDFQGFDGIEFDAIDEVLTSRPSADFGRVAIVGDGNVEKFASKVAKPFFPRRDQALRLRRIGHCTPVGTELTTARRS